VGDGSMDSEGEGSLSTDDNDGSTDNESLLLQRFASEDTEGNITEGTFSEMDVMESSILSPPNPKAAAVKTAPKTTARSTPKTAPKSATSHASPDLGLQSPFGSITDQSFVKAFIATMRDAGLELIVHRPNRRQSLSQPCKIVAFLRPGTEHKATAQFSTPCLEWQAEEGLITKRVDLFDIKSCDKASALQLERYPLAIPGRSILLRTHGGSDYVFETRHEATSLQFVHGIRWVVARLSFNVVIGNVRGSCELMDLDHRENGRPHSSSTAASTCFPSTPEEESRWTRAMNDATNAMIDKSAIS
jgi:hypothetical protein